MKTALFNVCIGHNPEWDLCLDSQKKYCEKYNIARYVSTEYSFNSKLSHIYFEKFQAYKLLSKGEFDRVLIIDSDVMISPSAPNIFEEYNLSNIFYGYDENVITPQYTDILLPGYIKPRRVDIMNRDPYVDITKPDYFWNKNKYNRKVYYNAGISLVDTQFAISILDNFDAVANYPNITYSFGDQTYLNALIQKLNLRNISFDRSWNYMGQGVTDTENERLNQNFIHYAGSGFDLRRPKIEIIKEDYDYFFGTN